MNNLRILQNNIRGFNSHKELLESVLLQPNNQPHIFIIQEGFRSQSGLDSCHFNNAYTYQWSETGRAGFLLRSDINSKRLVINPKENKYFEYGYESCWIEANWPNHKPILVCSFYRNCEYKSVSNELNTFNLCKFEEEVSFAKTISPNLIICGDINAHHPAWFSSKEDKVGEELLQFIVNNNLTILNQSPFEITREEFKNDKVFSSSIDVSLVSPSLVSLCCGWRTNEEYNVGSDHLPITFQIKMNCYKGSIHGKPFRTWNLKNVDWKRFQSKISRKLVDWNKSGEESAEIDNLVDSWTSAVVSVSNEVIGKKTFKPGNNKWYTSKLRQLKTELSRLKNTVKKNPSDSNLKVYSRR